MNASPKYLHIPRGNGTHRDRVAPSLAGRMKALTLCGRLVGRLSLVGEDSATCTRCLSESLSRSTQATAPDA